MFENFSFPLSAIIGVPALSGILVVLLAALPLSAAVREGVSRWCAVLGAAVTLSLLLALVTNTTGDANAVLQVQESHQWIPSLGVTYSLQLDGISAAFTLLTAVVSLVVVLWSARPGSSGAAWYALVLFAEASVMGAFLSTDLVLFYVFYELMLLPVLAAVALWGGPQRLRAALTFLLYTVAGSVFMLLAILYFGWEGRAMLDGTGNGFAFEVTTLSTLKMLNEQEEFYLGLAFLLAFAVKVPMVPLHAWAPAVYREAPHGVAAFTAALLGKVGIYGIIRFVWPLFPTFMEQAGPTLAAVGAVSVVYGALVALCQKDIRSLLAYSSVSHLGFCVLGLASASVVAWNGAIFQAVSHGLVTAGLFLIFGKVIDREGARDFDSLGGLAKQVPVIAFFLMVFSIASVALPLTSGFVGEFLVIMGSWKSYPEWTSVAALGVVLGAVYTLSAYLRSMFGQSRRAERAGGDLTFFDAVVLSALTAVVVVLGVFPAHLLGLVSSALPQ
jgi:NADH-quinone oxidoreductase subunit M